MKETFELNTEFNLQQYLSDFLFYENSNLFFEGKNTRVEYIYSNNEIKLPKYINEFWTAKQRQANSIHEVSYRACFKPHLPRFFIELLTQPNDIIYDPFSGRGTTIIEAALLNRNVISNDINPLSEILCKARLFIPDIILLKQRLDSIELRNDIKTEKELLVFFHPDTLNEILSIRQYLNERKNTGNEDEIDNWIRMVATNRLTGHSRGFFSVYTLPPNQAVSAENQNKINIQRNQKPEYRNTKEIIIKKTKDLIRNISPQQIELMRKIGEKAVFLNKDARETKEIISNSVQLTVTSPPFLDVVQYAEDNWLRCWFNNINAEEVGRKITMSKKIEDWSNVMTDVFKQLYRVTKPMGYVAFEVGEVRNGKIRLDEYVAEIGINQGFNCIGIMINEQIFTKTSNIWGVSNNKKGTNTNRIVIFQKKDK